MFAAENDEFKTRIDKYIKKALRKGVPPLFVDLRPLYTNEQKVTIIQELCEGYNNNLKVHKSFEVNGEQEPATALLWLLYYMAQHFDYKREFQKALDVINEAINHTPTLIELFMLKGKIFKHVGNLGMLLVYLFIIFCSCRILRNRYRYATLLTKKLSVPVKNILTIFCSIHDQKRSKNCHNSFYTLKITLTEMFLAILVSRLSAFILDT